MHRIAAVTFASFLLAAAGCSGPTPDVQTKRVPNRVETQPGLLDPLYLSGKPTGVKHISNVRDQAADGEEVVMEGRMPPASVKPYSDTMAVFTLMSEEDLASERVKEEFACDDAAT